VTQDSIASNAELAKQYFTVAAQNSASWDTYLKIRDTISESHVHIAELYFEKGDLSDLDIRGVGAKTIAILEDILSRGLAAARQKVDSDKREKIQQFFFGYFDPSYLEDPDVEDKKLEQQQARTGVNHVNESDSTGT
jgi:hypothetical protein